MLVVIPPSCFRPVYLKLRKCVSVEPLWLSMIFSEPLWNKSVHLDVKWKRTLNLKTIYLCTIAENETLLLVIYTDNNRNANYAENWEGK
jgi:hypothetical protein